MYADVAAYLEVSIPLKSGHIVTRGESTRVSDTSFNPLKVGSYCNEVMVFVGRNIEIKVSIPLKSGHIVT